MPTGRLVAPNTRSTAALLPRPAAQAAGQQQAVAAESNRKRKKDERQRINNELAAAKAFGPYTGTTLQFAADPEGEDITSHDKQVFIRVSTTAVTLESWLASMLKLTALSCNSKNAAALLQGVRIRCLKAWNCS